MDVLKSYAHQVVSYHPEKARDDLFAEIYDELCEEFADWQEQNPGRSETDFLDANREHPMKFATRLAAEDSAYLVGPQFYFSFLSALKIGATLVAGFYLFLATLNALAAGLDLGAFLRVLASIPITLLWVSAAILGVFIALEKSGERASWLDDWSAADLKPVEEHKQISRGETLFDLGVAVLALLWLVDIIHIPVIIDAEGRLFDDGLINLPDWFWIAAGVLLVFDIVYALFRLTRSLWTRQLRLASIASNVLWFALLGFAITQPELLSLPVEPTEAQQDFLLIINRVIKGSLAVVCAILVWDTVTHLWRLRR